MIYDLRKSRDRKLATELERFRIAQAVKRASICNRINAPAPKRSEAQRLARDRASARHCTAHRRGAGRDGHLVGNINIISPCDPLCGY